LCPQLRWSIMSSYHMHSAQVNVRNSGRVAEWSNPMLIADVDVALSNPESNFSATLVNSQLVCLPPVWILQLVTFIWIFSYNCLFTWSWKAPKGSGQLTD